MKRLLLLGTFLFAGTVCIGVAGPTPTLRQGTGADLTDWDLWWSFNREPYLNLKAKVYADVGPMDFGERSPCFFGTQPTESTLRPSPELVSRFVVPALKKVLATEHSPRILDSSLIALAGIGSGADPEQPEVEGLIRGFLPHPDPSVSETATVALGILARESSFSSLRDLATNAPAACELLGKHEVPPNMRAFACYGLGLLADRTSNNELRRDIAETLVDLLTSANSPAVDIQVAAMVAFGLTRIDPGSDPGSDPDSDAVLEGGQQDPGNRLHLLSRERQLDFLLDYLAATPEVASGVTRHWLVRAHAPAAMIRLLPGAATGYETLVAELLLSCGDQSRREPPEILMSATLALGQIGTAEDDGELGIHNRIRALLIRLIGGEGVQSRRFAMIALAQSAGRPGAGEKALAGAEVARDALLGQLSRGKTTLKPWAGLALGVMGRQLLDHGESPSEVASEALRAAASKCVRPYQIGAYLIGISLRQDIEGLGICLEKMEYFTDDNARAYAAVALGMSGDRRAIQPIQKLVRESGGKPHLLAEAAIALGLLGDKELVPDLVQMFQQTESLLTQAGITSALCAIGDSRAIDLLVESLGNKGLTDSARSFAAAALGTACDKEQLPWSTKISTNLNYCASTLTLNRNGVGILDML